MRKVIAAINMTIDGYCDHTLIEPDEEIHQHYADLLNDASAILYGRTTYQLMEYWREVLQKPTGDKSTDDFAVAIDKVPKIVFSRTLQQVDWESAILAKQGLAETVRELKQTDGDNDKNIYVGSPGLIVSLTRLQLVDEYQLCVHPVIAGGGLPLFNNIQQRTTLKLVNTKVFGGGAIILYYEATKR